MGISSGSRRLTAALGVAAAVLALTAGTNLGTGQAQEVTGSAAAGWGDDFDGPAGGAPDGGKWRFDLGGGGWGNGELETYTDSRGNSALDGNGNLVITARSDGAGGYTSARMLTSGTFTQAFGHFEARMKIPRGQGIWPAFWMLGEDIGSVGWPNCGEIDIMENIGREPGTVHGSLHGPGYSGGNPITGTYSLPGGAAFADDFHTFAVDWSPQAVSWSVDGTVYQTKTPADAGGNHWAFDHPFFIIVNVAVGGNWPGNPDGAHPVPAAAGRGLRARVLTRHESGPRGSSCAGRALLSWRRRRGGEAVVEPGERTR